MPAIDYDGAVFCHRDTPESVGANYRWPHRDISWAVVADLPSLPRDSFRRAVEEAFRRWAVVCGVRPFELTSGGNPNVLIGIQQEQPGNVLADCELPIGKSAGGTVRMRVDTQEVWCVSDNPPRDRIDLVRVLCHELGHGLGLSHGPAGCLMAPTYSLRVREPQSWDVVEMRARYGEPLPAPLPGPIPPDEPVTPDQPGDIELLRILSRGGKIFARSSKTGAELEL